MASRYWVGGSGTWDASTTTNWSSTTGGAGGASVPTSADDVFVDANSGSSPVITTSGAINCLSLNFTGAITPTFAGSAGLSVFGSLTFINAMTATYSGTLTLAATTTGKTITTNGLSLVCGFQFNGVGGGWTLQDNLTLSSINLFFGTLDTNSKNVSCAGFSFGTTGARSLTLGTSTVTCSASFSIGNASGLTLSAASSTIVLTGSGNFDGAGFTFNNVSFTGTTCTISGNNTFNIITVNAASVLKITSGTTQTVTNIVSNGVKGNRITIQSSTAASAASISVAVNVTVQHATVQDITGAGGGSLIFRKSQNVSGNSSVFFYDRFWVGGTGNINDTAHWATYSGGTGGASVPSTSNDSVYFDNNSFSSTGQTVTVNAAAGCLDMDWTGALNSPTFAGSSSFTVTGSLTFIAAMTKSYSGTMIFTSTATGKTITTAGSINNSLNFNGVGGGWTLQDDLTTTGSVTVTKGSFVSNNKNITCNGFNMSGTLTRTVNLGSSVVSTSNDWTATTTTGLTFTVGTSTIIMTGTTHTFDGGGLTYNVVTISATQISMLGSNTFSALTVSAGSILKLTSGTTQTVTTLTCNGTLANPSTLQAVTAGSTATFALPAGRYFIRHTSIKDITISGATAVTSIAGTNVSGNTGITFVTKFEMGRIKNDGSFNWYSTATGTVTKVSG